MAHEYYVDENGNIYKNDRYVDTNDPVVREALQNDPNGQKALETAREVHETGFGGGVTFGTEGDSDTPSPDNGSDSGSQYDPGIDEETEEKIEEWRKEFTEKAEKVAREGFEAVEGDPMFPGSEEFAEEEKKAEEEIQKKVEKLRGEKGFEMPVWAVVSLVALFIVALLRR